MNNVVFPLPPPPPPPTPEELEESEYSTEFEEYLIADFMIPPMPLTLQEPPMSLTLQEPPMSLTSIFSFLYRMFFLFWYFIQNKMVIAQPLKKIAQSPHPDIEMSFESIQTQSSMDISNNDHHHIQHLIEAQLKWKIRRRRNFIYKVKTNIIFLYNKLCTGIPFVICDFYFAFNDTTCANENSLIYITPKHYLIAHGTYMVTASVFGDILNLRRFYGWSFSEVFCMNALSVSGIVIFKTINDIPSSSDNACGKSVYYYLCVSILFHIIYNIFMNYIIILYIVYC